MRFVVTGDKEKVAALRAGTEGINWTEAESFAGFSLEKDAAAFFNLWETAGEEDYSGFDVPVFINSVVSPLSEIKGGQHIIRVNAWPGFIEKRDLGSCRRYECRRSDDLKSDRQKIYYGK